MDRFRKYRQNGKRYVEVNDLSFLYEREGFSWCSRHFSSVRCKRACLKADCIIVHSDKLAAEVVRYYFIPKSRIKVVPRSQAV